MTAERSPGEQQLRNFTFDDYLQMVQDGEAEFSVTEAARLMGVSRAYIYRCLRFASIPDAEFEDAMDTVLDKGLTSVTALDDEIKRRTGEAKQYQICCPHCGEVLYSRNR